ncbi:biopolymer transporter ExbD [Ichthyenterobacterium sp. W332]|uniref:Biopolymer transporter ExbD n=1 Tax=Microcosmobacter mediterraneus TaxID=3075607 RepID=A0ABU2YLT6_9FLAO|nr:biopolymer transporter ExbD [Ichthyenterobacterium sp. W332]MDT0558866.1 biopolymer transporter ExbD [Ichthyenterobacterium sp. W332]
MKTSRRIDSAVNAGSMADIAFLLLIFFLVTTTISADKGILRQLPPDCPPNTICNAEIHERNVLNIFINKNDELMVEDELISITDLQAVIASFIDNNGDGTCNYCQGLSKSDSSDNPKKAVVSLQHAEQTTYGTFIEVQDEITKAYYQLREDYATQYFNKTVDALSKDELKQVKEAYPFILSEAKTRRLTQ